MPFSMRLLQHGAHIVSAASEKELNHKHLNHIDAILKLDEDAEFRCLISDIAIGIGIMKYYAIPCPGNLIWTEITI